ncbi:MAG TPA: acetolactate synthase small subunit [Dokdonella sp.]|uniref:acetolactate synthase small subunit n=1 Tax=Dokdonella sp. TaxID=2291710 RepID=UPI002C179730|nr:acetolactate synthase small subunit [Dokdonella sp.]HUD41176.1 acetolactate synthase small subunit [Dokdonella sp.]
MRRIIAILLQNEAGALVRVAGLFSARGYNIDSLTVAATHDPAISRLTLVTSGDDAVIDQIVKQSRKLIDVLEIADLSRSDHLESELLIVKIGLTGLAAAEFDACMQRHPAARVVDQGAGSRVVQFSGTGRDVNAFFAELSNLAPVLELARSGTAAVGCGDAVLTPRA